jgi:hypothetical protein
MGYESFKFDLDQGMDAVDQNGDLINKERKHYPTTRPEIFVVENRHEVRKLWIFIWKKYRSVEPLMFDSPDRLSGSTKLDKYFKGYKKPDHQLKILEPGSVKRASPKKKAPSAEANMKEDQPQQGEKRSKPSYEDDPDYVDQPDKHQRTDE